MNKLLMWAAVLLVAGCTNVDGVTVEGATYFCEDKGGVGSITSISVYCTAENKPYPRYSAVAAGHTKRIANEQ